MRGGEGSADLDSPDSVSKKTGMTSSYERFASILLRVIASVFVHAYSLYMRVSGICAYVYCACIRVLCMYLRCMHGCVTCACARVRFRASAHIPAFLTNL